MVELSTQQRIALEMFPEWYARVRAGDQGVRPGFVVLGYAGTGKTFLARLLAEAAGLAPEDVCGGAFQASAAANLAKVTGWDCRTLHRWNYKVDARVGGPTMFRFNPESEVRGFALLVIDEISQLTSSLWNDTIRHGVPVLVLGDPGQLRPTSDDPADPPIAPMMAPDVVLTDIRRQDAANPVVHWSIAVREQGVDIPYGDCRHPVTGEVVLRKVPVAHLTAEDYQSFDAMLVWKNESRLALNHAQRVRLGFRDELPQVGERVICRRNQRQYGLINGFTGVVREAGRPAGPHSYTLTLRLNETGLIVPSRKCSRKVLGVSAAAPPPAFLAKDLSDITFGYAETVHGYIGRQANHVLVVDEHPRRAGWSEWFYTAMTRARTKVTIATL